MNAVLSLIAPPGATIDDAFPSIARDCLRGLGIVTDAPVWLAPGLACDIPLVEAPPPAILAEIRNIAPAAIDLALVPAANRRKRLLIADMDSTIVTSETLDELADQAGLKDKIAAITVRAMNGEIDFKSALRERVGLLAGLGVDALDRTYERVRLTEGAATLVKTMRANGAHTMLVSGGFRYFTNLVREVAGFHEDQSNDLLIENGKLTGMVAEPILDRDAKLTALLRAAKAQGLVADDALAVGDGANDLDMIRAAGLGVAFHAKPIVAEQARARIDHGDLTALLYLQGYRADEFVT